jgi:hypothetical protein
VTCPVCGDKGLVRIRYEDGSPDDFGVCRCAVGQTMRNTRNGGRETGYSLWEVWAAREQVDPKQICLVEDLLEPHELARIPAPTAPAVATSGIRDAMQTRRPKL